MEHMSSPAEVILRHYANRYRGWIIFGLVFFVAVWGAASVFYSVEADSAGVVLRFGKYSKTTLPGLHTKWPWPIDTVALVPVQQIQTLEFGFGTTQPGQITQYARPTVEHETMARMLTGDLNLAHVEWIVQYRIKNAQHYLFRIGGHRSNKVAVENTIRNAAEAVLRKLVGDRSVDEVITRGREEIASEAKRGIQEMVDNFEAGVEIVTVKLQSATPPEAVKDAFDAVNRARQNKERVVNEARGERNRVIPAARGQRDRVISEAEGYRERVVPEMTGRANAFLAQLAEYQKAPEVSRTRLYLEAMEETLAQVDGITVIDESVRGLLPMLNLSRVEVATKGHEGGQR
jgi:membrane protease subunit HflK